MYQIQLCGKFHKSSRLKNSTYLCSGRTVWAPEGVMRTPPHPQHELMKVREIGLEAGKESALPQPVLGIMLIQGFHQIWWYLRLQWKAGVSKTKPRIIPYFFKCLLSNGEKTQRLGKQWHRVWYHDGNNMKWWLGKGWLVSEVSTCGNEGELFLTKCCIIYEAQYMRFCVYNNTV